MRGRLTRESLRALMRELARSAVQGDHYRVYLVGGGTAVLEGWRGSSVDTDLYCTRDEIFHCGRAALSAAACTGWLSSLFFCHAD